MYKHAQSTINASLYIITNTESKSNFTSLLELTDLNIFNNLEVRDHHTLCHQIYYRLTCLFNDRIISKNTFNRIGHPRAIH